MTTFRFYIVRWLNLFHVFKGEIENMQKGQLDKRNWETENCLYLNLPAVFLLQCPLAEAGTFIPWSVQV